MKTLCTLLTVFILFIVGICLLPVTIPIITGLLGLAFTAGFVIVWFLPFLFILASDETTGGEKLAWVLAMIFLSWFAWIFYALLAPISRPREYVRYESPRYRRRYRYDY